MIINTSIIGFFVDIDYEAMNGFLDIFFTNVLLFVFNIFSFCFPVNVEIIFFRYLYERLSEVSFRILNKKKTSVNFSKHHKLMLFSTVTYKSLNSNYDCIISIKY